MHVCVCVCARLYSQIHLACLCRQLLRLPVENLSILLPLQRAAADWCLSEWQESGALWRALTCVPSLLQPDAPLIQLHHSGNSINSEMQLCCLSPHRAHYWRINTKKSIIHIWMRVASVIEIPASFWQVSLIIVCFCCMNSVMHEFSGVRAWWGAPFHNRM